MGSTTGRQPVEYYTARPTPPPRTTNQPLEPKVRDCVEGFKALRTAIRSVFGEVPVQHCVRHKERNVLDHLPERDRPAVKARLRRPSRSSGALSAT